MASDNEEKTVYGKHGTTMITHDIQGQIDEMKKRNADKSLSIAVGKGQGLIAVSEFNKQPNPIIPIRYAFRVTKPGVDDMHVTTVLSVHEIRDMIDMLQKIIEEE